MIPNKSYSKRGSWPYGENSVKSVLKHFSPPVPTLLLQYILRFTLHKFNNQRKCTVFFTGVPSPKFPIDVSLKYISAHKMLAVYRNTLYGDSRRIATQLRIMRMGTLTRAGLPVYVIKKMENCQLSKWRTLWADTFFNTGWPKKSYNHTYTTLSLNPQ